MKIQLNSPVSLDKFTHNKETRSFVTDASDLRNFNIFQRIYDDACDVGFQVRNPGTNRTILVSLSNELTDGFGEVQGWEFTPCEGDVRKYPLLNNYKFVIYND